MAWDAAADFVEDKIGIKSGLEVAHLNFVTLSGAATSRSEVAAESKDPYICVRDHDGFKAFYRLSPTAAKVRRGELPEASLLG